MNNSQVDALIRLHSQVVEMRAMITEFNGDENPSDIRLLTRLRNKLTNFLNFTRDDIPSVEVTLHRTKLYTIEAQLTDTVQQIIDMAYTFNIDWRVHLTIEKGSKQQQRERAHKRIAFVIKRTSATPASYAKAEYKYSDASFTKYIYSFKQISSTTRFIATTPATIASELAPLGTEGVIKAIARSPGTYKEKAYAAVV
uniref:Uncharacterized protein n=1 Tax=Glossina pallidipes TaxID=7398 RepID=A0A1B0A0U7_GLOPL